ncbi:hypothetical protein GOODEAATRI_013483 [Goodea atripinnis]|uniref:Uncharacterized protein n=1 Tax=Goodea atripinnis TaxID=208336 RepID=A0ABV0NJX2_9TELE
MFHTLKMHVGSIVSPVQVHSLAPLLLVTTNSKVFQERLIYWDFLSQLSLGFTEIDPKKRKFSYEDFRLDFIVPKGKFFSTDQPLNSHYQQAEQYSTEHKITTQSTT